MKLSVIAVGEIRDFRLRELCEEYRGRLDHHLQTADVSVKKGRDPRRAQVMAEEAQSLRGATPDGALTVAMTEEGKKISSMEVAQQLDQWMVEGRSDIAFYIGGANGLDYQLRRTATKRWSLSPMTFPHDVARMLLWEQLYRAMTIIRNEPYHK